MKKIYDEYEDEDSYENGYHDRLIKHRKEKRLKTALHKRDIDSLMELEEDDNF